MSADWADLEQALDVAGDTPVEFWLRDDDAVGDTQHLRRLAAWAQKHATEVLLAVIPASIESSLAPALRELKHLRPCVHGWAHRNHAPPGEKKQELGGA